MNYNFDPNRPPDPPEVARSDMGWRIYPKGIYYALKDLSKRYRKPIYILENGIADAKDVFRKDYVLRHLKFISKAISEKVDVRGYFYWSLIDNYEWAEGFGPKFGLVEVDFETLERKIRPSADVFKLVGSR
jgi:beta-glucosidase